MSRRGRTLVLILLLTGFAALATGRDFLFNLAYLWLGVLGVAWVWSWSSLRGLELTRRPRGQRAQVGRVFEERLGIRNRSWWPKLWVELHDESDLPEHRASLVRLGMGRGEDWSTVVRTLCRRRGRFHIGPSKLVAGDPFGLFPRSRLLPESYSLVVLPMVAPIPSFATPSGRLSGGEAIRRRTQQVTTNAVGVREYAPGDGFHRIHWPTTARRERLMVKEFELDPLADVWILIDSDRSVQASLAIHAEEAPVRGRLVPDHFELPPSTFEYSVAAAASLCWFFLQRNRAVGLVSLGGTRVSVLPQRGESQLYRLMETLAVLGPDGDVRIEDVLRLEGRAIPKGSTVILITPAGGPSLLSAIGQLRRSGLIPVVVYLPRESFGGPPGWDLAGAARRLGLPAYALACGNPIEVALWERASRPSWAA